MALNFSTPTTDFVQRTAESRKIVRPLVGDFTFDQIIDQHRHKIFLPRNMTKVLAFHDRIRTRGLETGTYSSSLLRSRGPFLGASPTVKKRDPDGETTTGNATSKHLVVSSEKLLEDQDLPIAKPDIESMSQDCLKVKAQHGSPSESSAKRRSVRNQLARQHEDKNAHLYFDVVNIRKKLNFKDNIIDVDQPPRKRARRETVPCHCHITIWDNRQGLEQKEPIVRKSETCEVSTTDLGTAGFSADIRMRKAFVFKSSDLNVPIQTPRGTVLGIGDQYFLEIKIIPTKDDVEWPPIPVLGRSEGDQTTGLGRMAAQKLQGTIVARYLHLPQAPASDVPLSVFYLHDSRTYRSKYGLEVKADWTKGEMPESMMKHEEDEVQIDLWALDDSGRSFGRRNSPQTIESKPNGASRSRLKQEEKPPPIKVTFNIDASSAKGAKDFRKCSIVGLGCPTCPKQTFHLLEELQFHFMTFHSKYKFSIEKEERSELTHELLSVVFKISTIGSARPRNQDREPNPHEKDLSWKAPPEPLDIPAYIKGDQTWVDQHWVEGINKKPDPAVASMPVITDKLSVIRQKQHSGFAPAQKGGFLPWEHVAPFRPAQRKRFPNIKLKTMTMDKEMMYTSVSHRQVHAGEASRSESDDEMDDSWFVKKSLEALDIAAEKQDWTSDERLLRRKWNSARMAERLSHPRYLSDCLIRFVRAEKVWLIGGGLERKTAFAEFLNELLQRRVINQEVIRDVWSIMNGDVPPDSTSATNKDADSATVDTTMLVECAPELWRIQAELSRAQRAEIRLELPPYSCAVCMKAIEEVRRHGVRCSEHDCEAPGVWYHNACIRCKRKDKLSWKCDLCIERIEEVSKAKGKEVALD